MKDKIKLKGKLKSYMRWPMFMTILLIVMNIVLYCVNLKAGAFATGFTAVYVVAAVILYFQNRPTILNELISFATQYGQVQKNLIQNFALPYALLDADGKVLWMNDEFLFITGKDKKYRRFIGNIFPEVTMEKLPLQDEVRDIELTYNEHEYRLT